MFRFLKYLFFLIATLIVLSIAAAGGALYYFVAVNPGPEIEESYIEEILGRESPVFYRDGREKIGVLFQDIHRQYLPYDRIPKNFVNAIVAAEDDQFFDHFGIDIPGITRAMIANIKAGRVVQGGSTITQQTAKNLFKRESRSYKEKLKELLFALRLEYHYSKEKILEFYTNQFFVSGNGHGLGVAARYYFDKDVDELNFLECAFIAGSVKRPSYYNPFTKKNKNKSRQAWRRAEERAGYVLAKMLKADMISKLQHDNARESDIVFNQGKMTFALNTVMDLVVDGLKSPEITEALEEHGISNVSTSGINIITSVDRELQDKTLYGLRRHLSRLDVRLRGYDREAVQKEYAALQYSGDNEVRPLAFLFGTIIEVVRNSKSGPLIRVALGPKQPDGVIDRQGLERMLTALVKHRENRWAEAGKKHLPLLLNQLQEGDRIYVSVREIDLTGRPSFDLERFPKVQGGALVVQEGGIRSMAGGMENRFFNRAIDARRLMGSTFKPFLFAAALQLGWNSVDMLDNRRNVFVFMDRPYFPRPDHHSPHDFVSMCWAGVTSENVAAVWLMYHLTDYLTPPRLREVAAHLDLAPRTEEGESESYQLFRGRIRDRHGIQVNHDALEQAAYDNAVQALEADFLFDDRASAYAQLKGLPFGLKFDRYAEELEEELKNTKLKEKERNELKLRQKILRKSYLGLESVLGSLKVQQQYVTRLVERERSLFSFLNREREPLLRPEGNFVRGPGDEIIYTVKRTLPDEWVVMPDQQIIQTLLRLDEEQERRFWNSVQLEGAVCVCAFEQVRSQMEREREILYSQKPYSMEVLGSIRDYREMVGLQYLLELGKACGIDSSLEPVLSFPLGSNVITLAEAVRMYETLITGKLYKADSVEGEESEEEGNGELRKGLAVIDRIDAPGGKVVYSRKQGATRAFDPATSAAVTNILQNVVSWGTGRYARDTVRLKSMERQKEFEQMDLPIPLMGKTGTANRFRNAAFLGYVPTRSQKNESVMVLDGGYSVGVYVGYDTNEPMIKGTTRITGSSGALPVWSDIADALLVLDEVDEHLDPVDLTFNGLGLKYPATDGMFVPVNPEMGGAVLPGRGARRSLIPPDSPVILSQGRVTGNGHFEPTRSFIPFWKNSTVSDVMLNLREPVR